MHIYSPNAHEVQASSRYPLGGQNNGTSWATAFAQHTQLYHTARRIRFGYLLQARPRWPFCQSCIVEVSLKRLKMLGFEPSEMSGFEFGMANSHIECTKRLLLYLRSRLQLSIREMREPLGSFNQSGFASLFRALPHPRRAAVQSTVLPALSRK